MRRLARTLTTGAGPALVGVSLAGWVAVLWGGGIDLVPHVHDARGWSLPGTAAWLLMVVAMMPPLLTEPVEHLWTRSLTRRRRRHIALFAAGYALAWMTAGWLLVPPAVHLAATAGHETAAAAALLLAALWQATPVKQTCLNRCHALPPLAAFGLAADRDALRYGLTTGGWCVGSCWALMLLPMTIAGAHALVMGVAMAVMLGERQARCRRAAWRAPLPIGRPAPRPLPRV